MSIQGYPAASCLSSGRLYSAPSRQTRTVPTGVKPRGSLAGSTLTFTLTRTNCSRHSSKASDILRKHTHIRHTLLTRTSMSLQRPSLVALVSQLDQPSERQHHHHCCLTRHAIIFISLEKLVQHHRAAGCHSHLDQLCHREQHPPTTWLPFASVLLFATSIGLSAAIRALVLHLHTTAKQFFTRARLLSLSSARGWASCTRAKDFAGQNLLLSELRSALARLLLLYASFGDHRAAYRCRTEATMMWVLSLGPSGISKAVGLPMRAFISHHHSIAGQNLLPCETAASNTLRTFRARLGLMYKRRRLRPPPEPPPTWGLQQAREHRLALRVHRVVSYFASHLSVIAGRHLLWCETAAPNTLRTC